jgi:predicted TIM-barrel fold metal-dependent hydrolase
MLLNNLFIRHPQARFVLFHGGYPWTSQVTALAKMFPNVHLDLVWLPQITKVKAIAALDEMLDAVPYNKLFWGGDCHFIEESVGSLEVAREVVAATLAARIARGDLSESLAREIGAAIFGENAKRFFRLTAGGGSPGG